MRRLYLIDMPPYQHMALYFVQVEDHARLWQKILGLVGIPRMRRFRHQEINLFLQASKAWGNGLLKTRDYRSQTLGRNVWRPQSSTCLQTPYRLEQTSRCSKQFNDKKQTGRNDYYIYIPHPWITMVTPLPRKYKKFKCPFTSISNLIFLPLSFNYYFT